MRAKYHCAGATLAHIGAIGAMPGPRTIADHGTRAEDGQRACTKTGHIEISGVSKARHRA